MQNIIVNLDKEKSLRKELEKRQRGRKRNEAKKCFIRRKAELITAALDRALDADQNRVSDTEINLLPCLYYPLPDSKQPQSNPSTYPSSNFIAQNKKNKSFFPRTGYF